MGVTHVDATIRNPAAPERSWKGSFLVDTGAIDSLVPRSHLDAIGLEPIGQRVYETTDGREVTLDITIARIDLMGELTAGVIIFGDAAAEPLLGVTALESAGVEVDPVNQRLKKLPSVRLKSLHELVLKALQPEEAPPVRNGVPLFAAHQHETADLDLVNQLRDEEYSHSVT